MTDEKDDLGLETLLAIRKELAPQLDEHLLRQCYAIQRRHQFDADRSNSVAAMDRLIDAKVSAQTNEAE
jgi:hypothetical protein